MHHITIPLSRLAGFRHNPTQRYGQAIYDHLQLNKVQNPDQKAWCDKLYNAENQTARRMVLEATDLLN